MGNYEIIYDDGIQENFAIWEQTGNMNAVKFTPVGYPATVLGCKINIGTLSNYPSGTGINPFVPFDMFIYDATGPGGTPGTQLAGPFTITPVANTYGWLDFPTLFGAGITVNSGSFYIVQKQGGSYPNAIGIAIDTTIQNLRSYQRFVTGGGPWVPASGNFMLRALVTGSGGPLFTDNVRPNTITASAVTGARYDYHPGTVTGVEGKGRIISVEGDNPENLTGYQVWRLLQGQESTPATWTSIGTPSVTYMSDNSWFSLPCNPYRWAVKAQYTGNRWSNASFSNVIGKCWTAGVTVNVTLSCAAQNPANTVVMLTNSNYPDTNYIKVMDTTGTVLFTNVWKGTYTLTVSRFGYTTYIQTNINITSDQTIDVVLCRSRLPRPVWPSMTAACSQPGDHLTQQLRSLQRPGQAVTLQRTNG